MKDCTWMGSTLFNLMSCANFAGRAELAKDIAEVIHRHALSLATNHDNIIPLERNTIHDPA